MKSAPDKQTKDGPKRSNSGRDVSDDDDENKLDFELLMRRRRSSTSSVSSNSDNEVWPLYLTSHFVDHYILGDVLGNGAYAEVRECVDTRNLERCAVKIINKSYLRRQAPRALANQKQEIKLLRRLKHENIIELKGTLRKSAKIYIFLEYCSFILSDLLSEQENNRLPVPVVRNLFGQLLRGLEYLHSQSIVHRDIKPSNLLVTTSGKLKIIDFGVSQLLSIWKWPSDSCENYEGSPLFQAPEVVSGQSEYAGFKVDIWSAGITLYFSLYGQYPFVDFALLALYDKILSEPFAIPKLNSANLSESDCLLEQQRFILTDLLASMLEKDAAKRCSVREALQHPWLGLRDSFESKGGVSQLQGNGLLYTDEHSEFIELLNRHPSSSLSSREKRQMTNTRSSNSISSVENSSTDSLRERLPKQRDIYHSMSVLPYLYSHHFSHIPVVKANRRTNYSSPSSIYSGTSSSTVATTTPTMTRDSPRKSWSSSSSSSSVSVSPINEPDSRGTPSPASSEPSPTPSTGSEMLNPHEVIADKEIEWGTRDQYYLLKLPLIRANRMRSTKSRHRRRAPRRD